MTDPQLINPSERSRGSGSPWWVSDNATGFSTLYTGAGAKQSLIVIIPSADPKTRRRLLAVAQRAALPSTHAVTVVKTTDRSSYTGLTSAFNLYAANFTKGRVDICDNAFHLIDLSKQYFDETPPITTTTLPKKSLWMTARRATTCLSTCKRSAPTLSSPTRSTRKVRPLKRTDRL